MPADAIAFWAANWREARYETKSCGEVAGFAGSERRGIVGEPLLGMGCPEGSEPAVDAGQHEIANHLAADTAGICLPSDDLAVPAADFRAIGGPALVGEARAMTLPSWARTARLPTCDCESSRPCAMRRKMCLSLTGVAPLPTAPGSAAR